MAALSYVQFVGTEINSATEGPIDRSLLVAFIELIKRRTVGRVADVGCGPGRVAAFMAEHGLDVVGVDVSEAMLAVARTAHPHIKFVEGQVDALPIETGVLAGAVCWYSMIYTPPDRLAEAFGELTRVLIPGVTYYLLFRRAVVSRYIEQKRKAHTFRSPATGTVCRRSPVVWRTPVSRSTARFSGHLNWNTKPSPKDLFSRATNCRSRRVMAPVPANGDTRRRERTLWELGCWQFGRKLVVDGNMAITTFSCSPLSPIWGRSRPSTGQGRRARSAPHSFRREPRLYPNRQTTRDG